MDDIVEVQTLDRSSSSGEEIVIVESRIISNTRSEIIGLNTKSTDATSETGSESDRDSFDSDDVDDEIIPALSKPVVTQQYERDFDKCPTLLYLMLQEKKWEKALGRIDHMPIESRYWISRKERDGRLRWRMLPIHAALVFQAPLNVMQALLAAFPKGAQSKDDQGMLPLHLAFRNGSTEEIVNLLLAAYPQSTEVKDRKGRIPLLLAQASTSPNKAAFIKALERGPSYFAQAAAATERASVMAEQQAIFNNKLIKLREWHQQEVNRLKEEADNKIKEMRQDHQHDVIQLMVDAGNKQDKLKQEHDEKISKLTIDSDTKIDVLQIRLDSTERKLVEKEEFSIDLAKQVESLENQVTELFETEKGLRHKIDELTTSLDDVVDNSQAMEANLNDEITKMSQERDDVATELYEVSLVKDDFQARLKQSELDHESTNAELEQSLNLIVKKEEEVRACRSFTFYRTWINFFDLIVIAFLILSFTSDKCWVVML